MVVQGYHVGRDLQVFLLRYLKDGHNFCAFNLVHSPPYFFKRIFYTSHRKMLGTLLRNTYTGDIFHLILWDNDKKESQDFSII